jgi:WW domain-binding protein 4
MTADNLAAGITPTEAPPPPPRRSRPVPSSSDPFSNYSTAESLGFVDPDAEANAAALLKQQSEGSIGQWEKVVKPPPLPPGPAPSLDAPIDESVAGETDEMVYRPSTFGREKVAAFDDDAYDPSLIALKLKRKRLTIAEEEESTEVAKVVKKEMRRVKEEERRKREESERIERGESKSGWNEVVKEEGYVLLFEEVIAKTEEGEETQVKEEVKEEDKDEKPVVEVVKAVFKKRRPNGVKQ